MTPRDLSYPEIVESLRKALGERLDAFQPMTAKEVLNARISEEVTRLSELCKRAGFEPRDCVFAENGDVVLSDRDGRELARWWIETRPAGTAFNASEETVFCARLGACVEEAMPPMSLYTSGSDYVV
jgi:sulfur carrier protein ThiS